MSGRVSRRAFLLGAATAAVVGSGRPARAEQGRGRDPATLAPHSTSLATFTHLIPGFNARYSPDGSQIVFDRRAADGIRELWLAQADGAQATCLSRGIATLIRRRAAGN